MILLEEKLMSDGVLFRKWENLVEGYAKRVDKGPFTSDISFTPHDYQRHCKNIMIVLGKILPESFYDDTNSLFILMVAVLFHDYAMGIEGSDDLRRKHSLVAKEWFLKEMEIQTTVLAENIPVDRWKNYITEVMYAHSDIKKEDGNVNTLKEIIKKYNTSRANHEIKVPTLAALLRLADELDITFSRLKGSGYEYRTIKDESKPHFDKLMLYENVTISPKINNTIVLSLSDVGDDSNYRASLIVEVYEKVFAALKEVNSLALETRKWALKDFSYQNIILCNDNDEKENYKYFADIIKKKKY